VPKTLVQYIKNTGDTDLVFLEMFKTDRFEYLSFSEWLVHTPAELVMTHLYIDKATLDTIPKEAPLITPI
jgi:oxalate decarboxylase